MSETATEPKTFSAQEQADARAALVAAQDDKARADILAKFPFLEDSTLKHFKKPAK